jgi:transposase
VSRLDLTLEPERVVRRLEIINGIGGRRRWSVDDKARFVEETLAPGAVVSEVARRHGLTPQQLFAWRRQARRSSVTSADPDSPLFVPAIVEEPAVAAADARSAPQRPRKPGRGPGMIEVEIGGVTVRVGRGAAAKTVAAVIRALKAGS